MNHRVSFPVVELSPRRYRTRREELLDDEDVVGWFANQKAKADGLSSCLMWCAAAYVVGPKHELNYPFLIAAGAVYQSMSDQGARDLALHMAGQFVGWMSDQLKLPEHDAAAWDAKLGAMVRDFGQMKTGVWASTRSKALLRELCPELLAAIAAGNSTEVRNIAMQKGILPG